MRILAVDDDPDILAILESLLTAAGHEAVTACTDPERAVPLAKAAEPPFELILLDIQMPGKDGIRLCRELRALDCCARVPIVMLTAMATREHVGAALQAGATDYLVKPFDPVELTIRIANAARLARAQTVAAQAAARPAARPAPARKRPGGLTRQELIDLFAEDFRAHAPLRKAG